MFAKGTQIAASERNFSTFGLIQYKLRNSLAIERVQKLVLFKINYSDFAETLVEYCDGQSSSDPENEKIEINET